MDEQALYMVPVVLFGIIAILYAVWLAKDVMSRDQGTPEMQKVSGAIFQGAKAYLNRQYRTIGQLAIVVAIVMGILVAIFEKDHQTERGIITAVAFLIGASLSGISGYIGMYVAVRSNIRTAAAARKGMGEALVVALRGGAVSGFLVVALGLLGISGVSPDCRDVELAAAKGDARAKLAIDAFVESIRGFVGNYLVAGPSSTYNFACLSGGLTTAIYQSGNFMDTDKDGLVDGANTGWGMFAGTMTQTNAPFDVPEASPWG